jgi:hypothetical protein
MVRWVIPEYENPVASLFVVVCALLPWEVARQAAYGGTILHVRWPFFEWYQRVGILSPTPTTRLLTPLAAYRTQAPNAIAPVVAAYGAWMALGALVFLLLVFAVILSLREERVVAVCATRVGRRPATVVGAALVVAGIGFLAATVVLFLRGIQGIRLPVGSLFMLLFGAVLLTNDA